MKLVRTRQNTLMWIVDVLLTLLAWGGLIWLLARGISAMLETHGGPRIEAPIFAALNTLQVYLWIALFNAVILISWARYQQHRGRKFAQRRAEAGHFHQPTGNQRRTRIGAEADAVRHTCPDGNDVFHRAAELHADKVRVDVDAEAFATVQ